jgi:hypothetical protein
MRRRLSIGFIFFLAFIFTFVLIFKDLIIIQSPRA